MMFKEYKPAEGWLEWNRKKANEAKRDNFAGALVATSMFALFPFLYCIASILDG